MKSLRFLVLAVMMAACLGGTILAVDYSFYSPGNGDYYRTDDSVSNGSPEFYAPSDEGASSPESGIGMFTNDYAAPSGGHIAFPDVWGDGASTSFNSFTLPEAIMADNGSLGILSIGSINLRASIFEGENLESMTKGVGHFMSTSAWEGNVGLCAHNRSGLFGRLKEVKVGDTITYETVLGTKTYKVSVVTRISETDFSYLGRSNANMLTLITCVENVPSKRLMVQAVEMP